MKQVCIIGAGSSGMVAGESGLPSKEEMERAIEKDVEKQTRQYKQSPRHTLEIDFFRYKDSLLKEMKRAVRK